MNRSLRRFAAFITLALFVIPLAAVSAQGGTTISCASEAPGSISDDASSTEWALVLKEAQAVTITATATGGDLDTYLILSDFEGAVLAENDDGLDMGYNSQIAQVLEAGRYTVLVTRFGQATGTSAGQYTLNVDCAAPTASVSDPGGEMVDGILFQDDFSVQNDAWWLGESDNGRVWLADQALHILNYTTAEFTTDTEPGLSISDFTLTVDAQLVDGTVDNWHYITFRDVDASNQYRVGFSADGYYMGEVRRDGQAVEEWANPTQTSAIVQGVGAINTARIEAYGDSVRFYVNDVLLIDTVVAATNAIPSGDIGLAVASMNGADFSEVAWDNLLVVGPTAGGTVETVPVGDVLFQDDFSVDDGTWWLTSDDYGDIYIENGELIIRDVFDDTAFSTGPANILGDFALEADTRLLSGTDNNWHFIVFRLEDTGKASNYYRVGMSADGYVVGAEFHGPERINWIDPTPSSAINTGVGATNRLRVEVQDMHVMFYVNGQLVLDQFAERPLPAGNIWLSADALEADDTVVAWDNVVVTSYP